MAINIETLDFTVGVVFGVVLTAIGTWLTIKIQSANQKKVLRNFCEDSITNICEYIASLDQHRDKTGIIVTDFLDLIEVETQIYGRNREHLSIIENKVTRKEIRDFFTETAIQVVRARAGLNGFNQLSNAAQSMPIGSAERTAAENNAKLALQSAHKACEQLAAVGSRKANLFQKVSVI